MKFIRDIIKSLTMDEVERVSDQYIKLLNDISVKIWKTDPEAEANIENYAKEAVALLEKFHTDILGISGIHKQDVVVKSIRVPVTVTATYGGGRERKIILWELILQKWSSGRKEVDIHTVASADELRTISTYKGSAWANVSTYEPYREARAWANGEVYDTAVIPIV